MEPVATAEAPAAEPKTPSRRATVAFLMGVANSGGLLLLGAYCLKVAVDAQHLPHAIAGGAGMVSGLVGLILRLW